MPDPHRPGDGQTNASPVPQRAIEDEPSPYTGVQYSLEVPGQTPPPPPVPPTAPAYRPIVMQPPPPTRPRSGGVVGGLITGVVLLLVVAGIVIFANRPTPSGPAPEVPTAAYEWVSDDELCPKVDLSHYSIMDNRLAPFTGDSSQSLRRTTCATTGAYGAVDVTISWHNSSEDGREEFESLTNLWLDPAHNVRDYPDDAWEQGRIGDDELVDTHNCGATLIVRDDNIVVMVRFWVLHTDDANQTEAVAAVTSTARELLELTAA